MATDDATDRVKQELHDAIERMRRDLSRVEILAGALSAFSRPIPDYEPAFRHLKRMTANVHEFAEHQG